MLMPKRVKRRKVQRGRLKGTAHKGNQVTYGDFGLVVFGLGDCKVFNGEGFAFFVRGGCLGG